MDKLSKERRSWNMSRIRSKGNQSTELKMVALLREKKLIGWRRNYPLEGKPDFVWPNERVALFVDGDFWHGHPSNGHIPKTNAKYWRKKIDNNKKRDRRITKTLRDKGWLVVRVWESEISKNTISRKLKKIRNGLL